MKKSIAVAAVAALVLAVPAAGCSKAEAPVATPSSTPATTKAATTTSSVKADHTPTATPTATLMPADGNLTDTDEVPSAVPGAGLTVTVNKAAQMVEIQPIDPATGKAFDDRYVVDVKAGTFVWHKKVAAMGKAYDYTLDTKTARLTTIIDNTGADVSESSKQRGAWDKAQAETLAAHEALNGWFLARYGMPMDKAIAA